MKFCPNCGAELQVGQEVCLSCGKLVKQYNEPNVSANKDSDFKPRYGYKISTGIIMIIIGACLFAAAIEYIDYDDAVALAFLLPGLTSLTAGILNLCSKKSHKLLLPAGILFLAGAFCNFLAILDISIFAIVATVFGILNIIYSKN